MNRPIFLSGKVTLDDGTPPGEPVTIVRVCGAMRRTEAYTDSKGRFSFELGRELDVMQDASDDSFGRGMNMPGASQRSMGGMGRSGDSSQMLSGCDLMAQLAGFRSESVNLAMHRYMDNPDVGTIIMHRIGNVDGSTISATTALAPKDAKKAFEKGFTALNKKKTEEAEHEFQKAVDIYPKFAAAWSQLGFLQQQRGDAEGARKSYAQALAADPKYVKPYEGMALLALHENNWREVKDYTDRLLNLNPIDYPDAWYYNAVANYQLHDMDAAEKSAREGIKTDRDHRNAKLSQLMGVLLAQKQDYAGAAQNFKDFLRLAPNSPEAEMVKKQLASMEQQSQASTAQPKQQ